MEAIKELWDVNCGKYDFRSFPDFVNMILAEAEIKKCLPYTDCDINGHVR